MAFKVNLIPNREFTVIHLNQYEYGVGNTRTVAIYNGDVPFDIPSGSDVTIEGVKPDGNAFAYDEGITFEDNEVTFELQDQMTVLAGQFPVEIVIRNSQGRWSTKNLIFDVEAGPVNENTPISDEDIPAYIDLAQRNANRAASAAETATSAATTATTAANTATSKASTATTAATTATNAANTATSKASTATTAASTATTAAANAKVSEDNAKDSEIIAKDAADDVRPIITEVGNVVTTENAKPEKLFYLKADLEPKQDFNGYDHPWPGGGGKNLLNYNEWKKVALIRCTAVFENNGVTITATGNDAYTANGSQYFPSAARIPVKVGETYELTWDCNTDVDGSVYFFRNGTTKAPLKWCYSTDKKLTITTVEGDEYLEFRFGVRTAGTTVSYKNIMIRLATETDATYEPYSNICPISGYTGVTVTRTGRDFLELQDKKLDVNGLVGGVTDKVLTLKGTVTNKFDKYIDTTSIKPGMYILNGCAKFKNNAEGYWYIYDTNTGKTLLTGANPNGSTVVIPTTANARIGMMINSNVSVDIECRPVLTEVAATYPITFPGEAGTVYGGTLIVNSDGSGTLTVDRASVDLGTLNWSIVTGNNYATFSSFTALSDAAYSASTPNILCSIYKPDANNTVSPTGDNYIWLNPGKFIRIKDTSKVGMTADEYKAAVTGQTLVYPLATPTTYALSAVEVVQMLEDKNTIWTDNSDHIEISYRNISKLNDYLDTMRGVSYDDITEAGTVTETGKKVVDAVQLNPNVNGTIAKRLAAVESTEVKKTDISRATNITSTGSKVVDAYELNASKSGTLAKKISDNTTNITKNTTALGGFSFGTTSDGKPGYKAPGADSVVPFKNGGFKKIGSLTTTFTYNIKYTIVMDVDVTDYDYIFAIENYTAKNSVNSIHKYTIGTTNFYSNSQTDEKSGSSSSGVTDSLKTIVMDTSEITGSVDISVTETAATDSLAGAAVITLYGVYGENGDSGSSSTRTDIIASVTGEFNTTLKTLTSSVDLSRYDLICIFEDDRPNAVHPYVNLEFVFKDTTSGTELFKKYHWHHHNAGGQDPRSDPNNNVWSMLIPVEDINNTVSITVKNTDANTPQPNGTITIYGFRKADAIKSGEALLVAFGSTGATIWFSKISNGTIGGDMTFYNLDFSDVKSFTFDFSNTSTGESDRNAVTITDSSGTTIMSATSGTCEINGRTGVKIKAEGVNGTNGAPNRVLKFFYYTDMNNNVHTL